jgi:hypothetical protein
VIDAREQCTIKVIALRKQLEEWRQGLADALDQTY